MKEIQLLHMQFFTITLVEKVSDTADTFYKRVIIVLIIIFSIVAIICITIVTYYICSCIKCCSKCSRPKQNRGHNDNDKTRRQVKFKQPIDDAEIEMQSLNLKSAPRYSIDELTNNIIYQSQN